jgi:origin recognition complex subunit 4
MCLIGITCRIDVLDLLEKRIKSRFSHRQVYTFNNYNFEEYLEMARYFLEFNGTWNKEVANSKVLKNNKTTIDELLKDKRILKLLNFQFEYDKSVSSLKNLLILPALKIKTQHITNLTFNQLVDEFESSYKTLTIDTKYLLLKGLSILELTLIVIMQELSETFVDEPFNFDLIYNSYLKFLQKNNLGHQKYERQIILKAYEHLILLKFILPASDNSSNSIKVSKVSKEHSLMYLALDKCEIQKCITEYPNCPTELSMLLRA